MDTSATFTKETIDLAIIGGKNPNKGPIKQSKLILNKVFNTALLKQVATLLVLTMEVVGVIKVKLAFTTAGKFVLMWNYPGLKFPDRTTEMTFEVKSVVSITQVALLILKFVTLVTTSGIVIKLLKVATMPRNFKMTAAFKLGPLLILQARFARIPLLTPSSSTMNTNDRKIKHNLPTNDKQNHTDTIHNRKAQTLNHKGPYHENSYTPKSYRDRKWIP